MVDHGCQRQKQAQCHLGFPMIAPARALLHYTRRAQVATELTCCSTCSSQRRQFGADDPVENSTSLKNVWTIDVMRVFLIYIMHQL